MLRTPALHRRLVEFVTAIGLITLLSSPAAAGQIGFVYALQQVTNGTNQIYGFRLDRSTGALTLLPGFPVASGGTGTNTNASENLAYAGGRLYVVNDGSDTLTAFAVNHVTGALTALPFKPAVLGAGTWTCVAVHPSGSPVVVGSLTGVLASVVVTATTATTAPGSPFATGANSLSCGFSQTGAHVYTGGFTGVSLAGFSVNASTGVLTALAGSPFNSGGNNPVGYATDSAGRLFTASFTTTQVRAYTTASGVPTAVDDNPFASGLTSATHGVLHPGGFYMVADQVGNRVGSYQITDKNEFTTLTPVSGSPFAAGGTSTKALTLTPDGAHLVAAHGTSRNLTVFQVNGSTGALTTVGVQDANTLGTVGIVGGLAFAPGEAGFVYALQGAAGSNQIHGFRINPSTGALITLGGFPIPSGGFGTAGNSENIAYRNGRLYVINDNNGTPTLTAFKVNRTTGAMTVLPFSPIGLAGVFDATCVAVHPSGSPVIVGDNFGLVDSIDVSATTVTVTQFSTGSAGPLSCAFSRGGSHFYTGGTSNGSVFAGFRVNAENGVLTALAGSPFAAGLANPIGYATDSSGRLFMVGVASGSRPMAVFRTTEGVPTGVSGNPFTSGLVSAAHGVTHQSGFYMVADPVNAQVGVYSVGSFGNATTLTAVAGSPFATGGSAPRSLTLTEDGAFLVAANSTTRNLTVFRVNPATGNLTSIVLQAVDTIGGSGAAGGLAFAPVIPAFIDDPLTGLTPTIKAVHILELRTRIDAVRAQFGLGPFSYTDPKLVDGFSDIRAVHVNDLRTALADVYTATGTTQPEYTDPTLTIGTTIMKFAHITELRAAVLAIE
jgi:6-phosphogluconolactonase